MLGYNTLLAKGGKDMAAETAILDKAKKEGRTVLTEFESKEYSGKRAYRLLKRGW